MKERIELLIEERQRQSGVSAAIAVSVLVHAILTVYLVRFVKPVQTEEVAAPIARYVQLMRQNPREFVEAPGPKVDSAPLNAPYSDANRRASMPNPTGETPTKRPGDGSAIWTPPAGSSRGDDRPMVPAQQAVEQRAEQGGAQASGDGEAAAAERASSFRQPVEAAATVDWRDAIRRAGQSGAFGSGARGMDLGGQQGGDPGYAESGPLSFETQWYDWGEYAQSMVSKIRVNWYGNMPQLIRTGLKGVVTIRFTIHRDGRISDVTIVESSGVPPYDQAAKKAIELSSPLKPLPGDFPNSTERVTCMFYYNMTPGRR